MLNISNWGLKTISFGAAIPKDKEKEYQDTINQAQELLGNMAIIIHGPNNPATPGEDLGVGSQYSKSAIEVMKFIKLHGFKAIQAGPDGKLTTPSPYDSKTFAGNTLGVVEQFREWGLITESTYEKILYKPSAAQDSNNTECDFNHAFKSSKIALEEAFNAFNSKKAKGDTFILELDKEFDKFKAENKEWLEKEAVYELLQKLHSKDPAVIKNGNGFKNWDSALDKNLYKALASKDKKMKLKAQERLKELFAYKEVEQYKFEQFALSQMKERFAIESEKLGVKLIADKKVAYSDSDVWGNQDAFIKKIKLGAPPDYFSKTGQDWDFPVLDPLKIFKKEQNGDIKKDKEGNPVLGSAGKLLYNTFDKIFRENPGGVRIDHIVGLIDPFVYPEGKTPIDKGAGRLYSSPENPVLSKYSNIDMDDIDKRKDPFGIEKIKPNVFDNHPEKLERYAQVLKYIIIPAAEKNGVVTQNIICEDLGTITSPVKNVMKKLGLGGIRITEFINPNDSDDLNLEKNVPSHYTVALGSHDNDSLVNWVENEVFAEGKEQERKKRAANITDVLKPSGKSSKNKNRTDMEDEIYSNTQSFLTAKVAAMFASKARSMQIFWPDLFGIKERYNKPGTVPQENWKLRIPENYQEFYYKQLAKGKGINIPEVMKIAIESLDKKGNKALIKKLDEFAQILKSPE